MKVKGLILLAAIVGISVAISVTLGVPAYKDYVKKAEKKAKEQLDKDTFNVISAKRWYCTGPKVDGPNTIVLKKSGEFLRFMDFRDDDGTYYDLRGTFKISGDKLSAHITTLNGLDESYTDSFILNKVGAEQLVLTILLTKRENITFTCDNITDKQPGSSGPVLVASAVICVSHRSANKAWAIDRTNNPYVNLPYDCTRTSERMPLQSVRDFNNLTKIQLMNYKEFWTLPQYVSSGGRRKYPEGYEL